MSASLSHITSTTCTKIRTGYDLICLINCPPDRLVHPMILPASKSLQHSPHLEPPKQSWLYPFRGRRGGLLLSEESCLLKHLSSTLASRLPGEIFCPTFIIHFAAARTGQFIEHPRFSHMIKSWPFQLIAGILPMLPCVIVGESAGMLNAEWLGRVERDLLLVRKSMTWPCRHKDFGFS
jgi:hypothetical protein